MLAMPVVGSNPKSFPPPTLTFIGPDKADTIFMRTASGINTVIFSVQVSKHSKPNLQMFRILPNGSQQPFCTAEFSTMSSVIHLSLNGQDIKISDPMGTGSKDFVGSWGKMTWKSDGVGREKYLQDESRNQLARVIFKEAKIEIYVAGEESFVDLVVATGVALMAQKERDAKVAKVALGVFNLAAGMPGVGN